MPLNCSPFFKVIVASLPCHLTVSVMLKQLMFAVPAVPMRWYDGEWATRTVKLANKNSARSCACFSPFVSAGLGCDCDVGLDVLLSVPLGMGAEARCVIGFVPVQAFCCGGCDFL